MIEQTPQTFVKGNLLAGKKILVMGVANDMSIGWGIAQACHAQGAELLFTHQSEILKKRVEPLAASVGSKTLECDVCHPESLDKAFAEIEAMWGTIDGVIHSIAFARKDSLKGRYVDTTQHDFELALNVSCYSFVAVANKAEKLMTNGGSIITLSYYGAEKAIPNYNVMGVAKAALEASTRYLANDLGEKGIRVNTISAGPIRTLAASGITDFRKMLDAGAKANPLRRNTSLEDVGGCAAYLLSDLGRGTTGEVIHVDCGFHAVGLSLKE
ncbi:MAG: enoyl-ACP reductase [Rickettsiales bacterium]